MEETRALVNLHKVRGTKRGGKTAPSDWQEGKERTGEDKKSRAETRVFSERSGGDGKKRKKQKRKTASIFRKTTAEQHAHDPYTRGDPKKGVGRSSRGAGWGKGVGQGEKGSGSGRE